MSTAVQSTSPFSASAGVEPGAPPEAFCSSGSSAPLRRTHTRRSGGTRAPADVPPSDAEPPWHTTHGLILTSQPYDLGLDTPWFQRWALEVRVDSPESSWYYPGCTHLVTVAATTSSDA